MGSVKNIFEKCGQSDDNGRTDGRTPEHGYTLSLPCEPDGSGDLKMTPNFVCMIYGVETNPICPRAAWERNYVNTLLQHVNMTEHSKND